MSWNPWNEPTGAVMILRGTADALAPAPLVAEPGVLDPYSSLTSKGSHLDAAFGSAIAVLHREGVYRPTLVIGAPGDYRLLLLSTSPLSHETYGPHPGSSGVDSVGTAYVFHPLGAIDFYQDQKVTTDDTASRFGTAIVASPAGDTPRFIVGAPFAKRGDGEAVGHAYVYGDPTPAAPSPLQMTLERSSDTSAGHCPSHPGDRFGETLAVGGLHVQGTVVEHRRTHLAVGAPSALNACQGAPVRRAGEVYVYRLPENPGPMPTLLHRVANPELAGPPGGSFGEALEFLQPSSYRFQLADDLVTATVYPQGHAGLLIGEPLGLDSASSTRPGFVWGTELSGPSSPNVRLIKQGYP
jgi:hypothetical protein